jgi:hypothetical protein
MESSQEGSPLEYCFYKAIRSERDKDDPKIDYDMNHFLGRRAPIGMAASPIQPSCEAIVHT